MTENQELSLVEKILKSNVQDMHRGRTKLYTDLASTLPQFEGGEFGLLTDQTKIQEYLGVLGGKLVDFVSDVFEGTDFTFSDDLKKAIVGYAQDPSAYVNDPKKAEAASLAIQLVGMITGVNMKALVKEAETMGSLSIDELNQRFSQARNKFTEYALGQGQGRISDLATPKNLGDLEKALKGIDPDAKLGNIAETADLGPAYGRVAESYLDANRAEKRGYLK